MKRAVVVENLPGAGGMTGTYQMVRTAKDGNTLALVPSTHVINPSIYKNMPFDSIKDVSAVAIVGDSPGVVLVHPSLPVKTLPDLIALARSKPGQLNYGSSGNGTNIHLMSVMLLKEGTRSINHALESHLMT